VLGRSLVLGPGNRAAIGFVFISGALPLAGSAAADAPRRLASIGLLILLLLAAALMVQPFVFSPTFIAAAAILGCLVVVRPDGRPGRAAPRLVVAYVLGMMAILSAGWLIEVGGVTASTESPARAASLLLGLGIVIIVVTPPFHTWLTASANESHPMALVFLATALQSAGLFLLLNSLASYSWMRSEPLVFSFLRGAGLLMIGLGGAWCLAERRGPRIVAYALLVDFGVSLLAAASASPAGYGISLGMAGARAVGAVVWGLGFSNLRAEIAPNTDPSRDRHPIRPLAAAAALAGALSLAGFPLTAGFAGRWMTLATVHGNRVATLAVVFGVAAVAYSVIRWARGLGPPAAGPALPDGRRILLIGGTASIVILGILPGWLYAWALSAIAGPGAILPRIP
jgi:formate hydrogenlyase subunit 3/multisubunit Na+/H+ antiporter MnhD subunit